MLVVGVVGTAVPLVQARFLLEMVARLTKVLVVLEVLALTMVAAVEGALVMAALAGRAQQVRL